MRELVRDGKVETPHPYLRFYLGWKRWSKPESPVAPMSGGWDSWDFETTQVLEMIEEMIEEARAAEERRTAAIADAKKNIQKR